MLYVCGRGNLRGLLFQLSILTLGVGLISCGKLPDYQVLNTQNAFVADAELNPNVDLLFVIDNSGSMQRDQDVLAASFSDFISNFTDKNLQYHIGVISTDTCPSAAPCNASWWSTGSSHYPSIFNGGMGSLLTKYFDSGNRLKFLTWDMDPIASTAKSLTITRFTNNANLGTNGSGSEAPLSAVISAINQSSGYNDTFFRAGAFTSIIIVSDEDEGYGFAGTPAYGSGGTGSQSYLSGRAVENNPGDSEDSGGTLNSADQNTRVNAFLASLEGLKGSTLDNFSLNVVAVPHNRNTCVINSVAETADNFEPALTLYRTTTDINSNYGTLGSGAAKATFTDICTDFSAALNQIGSDIVEANARYALAQLPADSDQILVFVNGSAVARSTVNGWEYNATDNSIQFYGTAVPSIGDSIAIDYTPGAPI